MSNTIMELVAEMCGWLTHSHRRDALPEIQAEVTSMEQELAEEKRLVTRLCEHLKVLSLESQGIKAKLAALEAQEPVAWYADFMGADENDVTLKKHSDWGCKWSPLYLSPCAASVPMSDTEGRSLADRHWPNTPQALVLAIVRTAEAHHRIGVKS